MKKLLSKHIIKQSVRDNWKLWTILTGSLCLFITVITFVSAGGGTGPGGMGGSASGRVMINLYANMFFSNMGILLTLIFAVTAGNRLVAGEIDRGTMSFTLNTPITRIRIILSKMLFYIVAIVAMAILMGIFAVVSCGIAGRELPFGTFAALTLGFCLFGFATGGICFAASCWFNKTGYSLAVGAGFSVAFYLLNSLSRIDDLEFLKYFSLNTLFDAASIATGAGFIGRFIALGIIGIALYAVGTSKFLKKDLPL